MPSVDLNQDFLQTYPASCGNWFLPDNLLFLQAGDTVNIQNGKLYVNGAEEKQEGTLGETLTEENNQVSYPLTVGDDQIFVLGDNREVSDDSRAFGVVDMDDVKGRIVWYMGRL